MTSNTITDSQYIHEISINDVLTDKGENKEMQVLRKLYRSVLHSHLHAVYADRPTRLNKAENVLHSWEFLLDMHADNDVYAWVDGAGIPRGVYKDTMLDLLNDKYNHIMRLIKNVGGYDALASEIEYILEVTK